MRTLPSLAVGCALLLVAPSAVSAQAPERPAFDWLVRTDPFSDDPIGIDAHTDLYRVPITEPAEPPPDPEVVASRGPRPPSVEPAAGSVLTAIPGVRETDHRVRVRLADGLAQGEAELRFRNGARHRAEVRYRLAVPDGASVEALEVCVADKCRRGVPHADGGPLGPYDDAVRARPPEGHGAPLPVADAHPVDGPDGRALILRAAPLAAEDGELTLRVRWVAPAPVRGGVVRLRLPARGRDPRAAPAELRVEGDGLLALSVGGRVAAGHAFQLEAWEGAEVTAHARTGGAPEVSALHFPCGEGRCARLRVAAGPRPGRPVDLVVLVDASPSMEGPARGRVSAAVASLLASAPAGSRVRAAAFGARSEPILAEPRPVDAAPLAPFARAAMRRLGAATRFEAAWELVGPWLRDDRGAGLPPQVVVVGDGGLQQSDAATAAFEAARRAGVEVSVLNVADRATWDVLRDGAEHTGGVVVEAGEAADRAARGRGSEALEEAVARIFAPVVAREVWASAGRGRVRLGPLRAGEERVWLGALERPRARAWIAAGGTRARSRDADEALGRALAPRAAKQAGLDGVPGAWVAVDPADLGGDPPHLRCDALGPPRLASGVSSDPSPVAPAEARSCQPPAPDDADAGDDRTGVPASTVLSMLRQRVVPAARQCFRRDRAGRARYSVHATFELRLADREVVEAGVSGEIAPELRRCLEDAVHDLDVPRFEGTVRVRYPVYTQAEPRPPTIQLEPEVAHRVDSVLR